MSEETRMCIISGCDYVKKMGCKGCRFYMTQEEIKALLEGGDSDESRR